MAIDESLFFFETTNNQTNTTMKTKMTAVIYHPATLTHTALVITLHQSDSPNDRILSEDKLYRNASPELHPDGIHYEMEISEASVRSLGIPQPSVIHAIQAEDDRYFVCYPNKVETEEDAERIFRIWALGTVASMHEGRDVLVPNFDPHMSADKFSEIMGAPYGVTIVELLSEFSETRPTFTVEL